jgi:uncharacterized protein YdiU (UPF0061 family)
MGQIAKKLRPQQGRQSYERIRQIDGYHPFQDKVPFGYVAYQARTRKKGKVAYFNFGLAKEMGLIPQSHDHEMTEELSKALLDTFAITIINEYDIIHGTKIDPEDIKPNRYMATRYLQLQHPNKQGITSGDGRSVWNGYTTNNGVTWDISSCGTGATCLSPATAIQGKFFKTGDPLVSYGCGFATLSEGVINILFSEIFKNNNIASERVLCVIEFPGDYAINVRAAKNLMRPSHFFNHLKQGQYDRLKSVTDFFIDRQISNGEWKPVPRGMDKYDYLLTKITETFAAISAQWETEYIFCWLDWDGDNILADGGIIDFGSVRQFGLYHHEYRFDDDERWSTNIKQQKLKAMYTVQTFAQLVDYLKTGNKKPSRRFARHPSLKRFQQIFTAKKRRYLLAKMGFTEEQIDILTTKGKSAVGKFEKVYYQFEMAKSKDGPVKVPDGITTNAIFCMRDILRELPAAYAENFSLVSDKTFMGTIKSTYAHRKDMRLTPYRKWQIKAFQQGYQKLVTILASETGMTPKAIVAKVAERAAVINKYARITGDGICVIGEEYVKKRKTLSPEQFHAALEAFINEQSPPTTAKNRSKPKRLNSKVLKLISDVQDYLIQYREGL